MMKIKKGDTVEIIAGKDKGKSGKVLEINRKKGVLYVEGLNMITKHTKPSVSNQQGGIVRTEGPLDISNVMYLADGKRSRIGFVFDGVDAKGRPIKKRVAKATGKIID